MKNKKLTRRCTPQSAGREGRLLVPARAKAPRGRAAQCSPCAPPLMAPTKDDDDDDGDDVDDVVSTSAAPHPPTCTHLRSTTRHQTESRTSLATFCARARREWPLCARTAALRL